jgi:glycylpeptide N-tetradecanoyltransferase
MTLARMIRVNKVPSSFSMSGLRPMEEKDVSQVADLFMRYMKRFGMSPLFDLEETKHQFLSGNGTGVIGDGGPGRRDGQVTWSYVVEVVSIHTDHFYRSLMYLSCSRIERHIKLRIFSHSTLYHPR